MPSSPSDLGRGASIIDLDRPNPARIDNALLGGGHNFAADRRAATALLATDPMSAARLRRRQNLLRDIAGHALDVGIQQFVGLGCGIPFPYGIHTIIQRRQVSARVVYVDDDPVVIELIRQVLGEEPAIEAIEADPGDPAGALDQAWDRRLIEEELPVLVLSCQPPRQDRFPTGAIGRLHETHPQFPAIPRPQDQSS